MREAALAPSVPNSGENTDRRRPPPLDGAQGRRRKEAPTAAPGYLTTLGPAHQSLFSVREN